MLIQFIITYSCNRGKYIYHDVFFANNFYLYFEKKDIFKIITTTSKHSTSNYYTSKSLPPNQKVNRVNCH